MPPASDAKRAALRRLLRSNLGNAPSWQLLVDEVEAGAQVLDSGKDRADQALVMMNLRAEAQSHTPINRDALRSLPQSSPRLQLNHLAVFGATVDGQILVADDDRIVTCWVYPKDIGVVLATKPSQ